ncbi:unnamed protein product [Danaus chrysippus]|uniref:(African queen) hypothetical protein n=1 Tax=Danaus chrysippus TaxID=151541 RepID=A0A8J2RAH3_9NEOP|nr:unnamed protein product [Danaus chrysippus]
MRDLVAAHSVPAPQAPARNTHTHTQPSYNMDTFNSHARLKRPKLGDKKVYRPVRRATLSRIDETPTNRSYKSMDFSTRPNMRSRSNVSADTSRSVPVCNQSQDIQNPEYSSLNDTKAYDSSEDVPASMTDLPIMVPLDRSTGSYIPYPEYSYDSYQIGRYKYKSKNNNLFLAFMY